MNRRSMTCDPMFGNNDRIARVRRLLDEMHPNVDRNLLGRITEMAPNGIKMFDPVVTAIDERGPVQVVWFDDVYCAGIVLVDKATMDSLDDRTLSKHLLAASLRVIKPQLDGRPGDYYGDVVWIKYGQCPSAEVTRGFLLPSCGFATITENLSAIGGLSMSSEKVVN